MKVKVRFFTTLREITNKREEEIEVKTETTVEQLLKHLEKKYGSELKGYVRNKRDEFRDDLQYLINGKNVRTLQGFNTELKEEDTVAIIPPVGGG